MRYANGNVISVSGTFRNEKTKVLLDPTVVYLEVTDSTGDVKVIQYGGSGDGIVSAITKEGTGQYTADITPVSEGWHYYRWYSTGTGQAAEEGSFYIF